MLRLRETFKDDPVHPIAIHVRAYLRRLIKRIGQESSWKDKREGGKATSRN